MGNPAVYQDVEARWRPLSTQEQTTAQTLLEDVWRLIKRRIPDVEARIADDSDYGDDVIMVEASAVLRVLKNPDGKRQESIDDYTYIRDRANSAGDLYVSDKEWSLLLGETEGKAFSIDTMPAAVDLEADPLPVSVTGIPEWLDWS